MTVGHGLNPGTTRIQPISVPHPHNSSRHIILLDTPGFNANGYVDSDHKVIKDISDWLKPK